MPALKSGASPKPFLSLLIREHLPAVLSPQRLIWVAGIILISLAFDHENKDKSVSIHWHVIKISVSCATWFSSVCVGVCVCVRALEPCGDVCCLWGPQSPHLSLLGYDLCYGVTQPPYVVDFQPALHISVCGRWPCRLDGSKGQPYLPAPV